MALHGRTRPHEHSPRLQGPRCLFSIKLPLSPHRPTGAGTHVLMPASPKAVPFHAAITPCKQRQATPPPFSRLAYQLRDGVFGMTGRPKSPVGKQPAISATRLGANYMSSYAPVGTTLSDNGQGSQCDRRPIPSIGKRPAISAPRYG